MTLEQKKMHPRLRRIISIGKLVLLLAIAIGIPTYILIFHRDLIAQFNSYQDIVAYLQQNHLRSIFLYLIIQILQIIISVLPGQVFQIAAGSVFGFVPGLLLSITGAFLGEILVYHFARILGEDGLNLLIGEQRMLQFHRWFNSERAYVIVFLIYLIPGMPKDLVCYAAGISEMKLRPFLFLSIVARIPAMCISLLFGKMYIEGNHTVVLVLGIIAVLLFILCIVFRKRVREFIDSMYERMQ